MRTASVLSLALMLTPGAAAFAFPFLDSTENSDITGSRDLTGGEATDLMHQLQLVNGVSAPAGGGWTFLPRLELDEQLTDNVYQAHTPQRTDLTTFITPGISVAADLPRLQLTASYNPTLALYARTGDLNSLTQQLSALGELTVAPDLAYLDVRAAAGVNNLYGGYGANSGLGAVSSQAGSLVSSGGALVNNQGLSRQNETQTASFGMTPYLRRQFGDLGVARVGYSIDVTRSNSLSGFASVPFPTGGQNGRTLVTNEEFATFTTGDVLNRFQDAVSLDLSQSQSNTDAGFVNGFTGQTASSASSTRSTNGTYSNQVTYQVNRALSVFAMGGWEDIQYTGSLGTRVNDFVWRYGATLTGPDSSLTVSYGHQNGFNSFAADGHWAISGRTALTLSYNSTLGTQLQYVQAQLNSAVATTTGQVVNGTTGGPLFVTTNALAQQDALYRTDSLVAGATTSLDRDVLSATYSFSKQTTTGTGSNGVSTDGHTLSLTWVHEMRPDMTANAGFSANRQNQLSGAAGALGNYWSYAASVGWQYLLTETVSVNVRYSFFDRISQNSAFNVYQSLLFAGISKTF